MTTPSDSSPPPLNTALAVISQSATAQLDPIWSLPPHDIIAALFDTLPALLDTWGIAAASAAADWYDELRAAANISGRFTAIVEPLGDLGANALAGWAAQPLSLPESDVAAAQYRADGGLQKRLVNAANKTVTGSAERDPHAKGYMRQTRPGACRFCVMVASRGGVYTKTSSTFACHEHCYCRAVPAWGGKELPVGPYKPSERPSTPEDRARVRRWIADNL
jgi:hypothetical protein